MLKQFLASIVVLASGAASAEHLPHWADSTAELTAYRVLFESMARGPYYSVASTTLGRYSRVDGEHVFFNVRFDDSRGCRNRTLQTDCAADGIYFVCHSALNDCYSKVEFAKEIRIPLSELVTR